MLPEFLTKTATTKSGKKESHLEKAYGCIYYRYDGRRVNYFLDSYQL
jgi:uncharacterized membrane-anchored protein